MTSVCFSEIWLLNWTKHTFKVNRATLKIICNKSLKKKDGLPSGFFTEEILGKMNSLITQ